MKDSVCLFFAARGEYISLFKTQDTTTCNVQWHPLFLAVCFSSISCLKNMPLSHTASIEFDSKICGVFILFQNNKVDYYFLAFDDDDDDTPELNTLQTCNIQKVIPTYQINFTGYSSEKIGYILSKRNISNIYNVIQMSTKEEHEFQNVWLSIKYNNVDLYTILNTSRWISELLLKKNNQELDRINYACQITRKGFQAAWRCFTHNNTNHLLKVRHVIDAFEKAVLPFSPKQYAYVPIITQHSEIHPNLNVEQSLDPNLSIVMDMGIRWQGMCCDITRTYLSKKSNPFQKQLYTLIYDTLQHVTKMVKPGVTFSDLSEVCFFKLAKGLVDLDLTYENVSLKAAHALMPHSLGHSVGWNVHDDGVQPFKWILQEGHVLALEPGLYFTKDGHLNTLLYKPDVYQAIFNSGIHAIRIEDTMTVTKGGVHVFSTTISY